MALVSPGVQVTISDESQYAPSSTGSTAYILLATEENKVAPGGTSFAAGTLAENTSKIYNITSQRDLITTFGVPKYVSLVTGAPANGDERNEHGLMTAYSALGVSNNIYVHRADIDLSQLEGTSLRPTAPPTSSTFWLDLAESRWGIYRWDASSQTYVEKRPVVISSLVKVTEADVVNHEIGPDDSYGTVGSFAVVTTTSHNHVFEKMYDNTWQMVGTENWQSRIPTISGTVATTGAVITEDATIVINQVSIGLTIGNTLNDIVNYIGSAGISGVSARINSFNQLVITAINSAASDGVTEDGKIDISNDTGEALAELGIEPGIYNAATTAIGPYYQVPNFEQSGGNYPTGSIWFKTSATGSGLYMALKQYDSFTGAWKKTPLVSLGSVFDASLYFDPTGGGYAVNVGDSFVDTQIENVRPRTLGSRIWTRKYEGQMIAVGGTTAPINPGIGSQFSVTVRPIITLPEVTDITVSVTTNSPSGFVSAFNQAMSAAMVESVYAEILSNGSISIVNETGGDVKLGEVTGTPLANVGLTAGSRIVESDYDVNEYLLTNWAPLDNIGYYATVVQPFNEPVNDTLWYNNAPNRVDIMIHDGNGWAGYRNVTSDFRGYNLVNTNENGVITSASIPTEQEDGTTLEYGDLWLDTSDLENYPKLSRWQRVSGVDQWVLIDHHDNTSSNGIVFGDARWATSGNVNPAIDSMPSLADLALSDYVDLDAPDPDLYARGTLLFNTRASGYTVKQFKSQYFSEAAYPNDERPDYAGTWVSVAGYVQNNIPNFGRKSQRGVIIAALKAAIDSSTTLREDAVQFNLIACPGYPELIPNMIALNNEKNNTAFIVGDTPMRLPSTGTDIQDWASNAKNAAGTGEYGLTVRNPYVGCYYPSGLANDLSGNSIVVPPSYAALRTILNSDNASYPWFAPAGTRRGRVDNIDAIGYIESSSGKFVSVGVNQGLRDVMYTNQINPITSLPGSGLVVYGQKTLQAEATAMDRINVARLVNYIRKQLDTLSRPFLFEPNDTLTRNNLASVVNSLMIDLVAKRGVADYVVVCDGSNNTPDRINRNELWVDIAVQPTKAVEFIYVPVRLVAAGQLQGTGE